MIRASKKTPATYNKADPLATQTPRGYHYDMFRRTARPTDYTFVLVWAIAATTCLISACSEPNTPSPIEPKPTPPPEPVQEPAPSKPPAAPQVVPPRPQKRWLYAERFAPGTNDGYVEGDFSAKRNRLTIDTYNVTQFAVDTRYLDINWDKLVVIRINGHNSELKQRDDPVLHFVLDRHNQWVVAE